MILALGNLERARVSETGTVCGNPDNVSDKFVVRVVLKESFPMLGHEGGGRLEMVRARREDPVMRTCIWTSGGVPRT